ncbi:hypothetical protein SAMN04489713_105202 [Actinomadura madurae]|uniref:Uncharacterized protein n=1 Tax=Actinomadura madurae TaxID=1993 RepID=A0A1I5GH98_9ACTN|nr:hypothetical protein SAMN04489713_105202 [Actinomadura madurae]SPT51319.1 Uncharacterised protein [Actinomadura madurae]
MPLRHSMRKRLASSLVIPPLSRLSVWERLRTICCTVAAVGPTRSMAADQAVLAELLPTGGVFSMRPSA